MKWCMNDMIDVDDALHEATEKKRYGRRQHRTVQLIRVGVYYYVTILLIPIISSSGGSHPPATICIFKHG